MLQEKRKLQEQIICEIKKAYLKYGIEDVSVAYLIKATKIERRNMYRLLDMLLDNNIICMNIFSICPYCYESNIQKSEVEKVKCSHCNEIYLSNDIIEKYRINSDE